METLQWDAFMRGEIIPKQIKKPIIAFSLAPLTLSSLFDMSPLFQGGLTVILVTSTIAVGSAFLTSYLIKKGEYEKAELVSLVTKIGLIIFGVGSVGFLFFKNPLWGQW
ncbi:hypothetical protein [Tuberibacillus calidus]|uniref:hypothetical protein n=1 Tax=Tuberibacillus calidus TaxID=340097 RepID=UPI000413501C|nr:hypothetical protein [Tuberibacillus calidus]